MVVALLSANSRALWYLTRGFGLVSLVLLTVTVVLGISQAVNYVRPGLPRFVVSALHKNASLLALALLAVHILTAVADTYAPIRLVDTVIPWISRYRPFWLGLGALAFDCLIALVITSLLRPRIGYGTWRRLHWLAYASWPIAVVHALGTGTDARVGWVQGLYALCFGAVLVAVWWRLGRGWSPANAARRGAAFAASLLLPATLTAWALSGPLRSGWARRAGTPLPPVAATAPSAGSSTPSATGPTGSATGRATGLALPLSSTLTGTQAQSGPNSEGLVSVTLSCSLDAVPGGRLTVVLTGTPLGDGGVQLTGSQVTLGTSGAPSEYTGHLTDLAGTRMRASLTDAAGNPAAADIFLRIGNDPAALTGTVEVSR